MAALAYTVTDAAIDDQVVLPTTKCFTVTLDVTNYNQTGDISITAARVGMSSIVHVEAIPTEAAANANMRIFWDGGQTTAIFTLWLTSSAAEVSNDTDGGTWRLIFYGR